MTDAINTSCNTKVDFITSLVTDNYIISASARCCTVARQVPTLKVLHVSITRGICIPESNYWWKLAELHFVNNAKDMILRSEDIRRYSFELYPYQHHPQDEFVAQQYALISSLFWNVADRAQDELAEMRMAD